MQIRLASGSDVEQLTSLFDLYRQSLGQPSESYKCRQFVSARLSESDTMIFIASHNIQALGFIQLYPSHSSVSLKPIWYFDDAFVVELYRGTGIAKELIAKAKELADSADVLLIKRTLIDHNVQGKPLAQDALPHTGEASHDSLPQGSVETNTPVYMYHQAL